MENTQTGGPRWQTLYNALGAFSVASVLAAVGLNYLLLDSYRDAVAESRIAAARSSAYAGISRVATLGNGPGNDVFENRDIPGESKRLAEYEADFEERWKAARAEIQANVPSEHQADMLRDLDAAHDHFTAMMGSARGIFDAFRVNDVEKAGSIMALMDRQLADTSESLANLTTQVQAQQEQMFATQLASADRLQYGAYGLLGLMILMVAGVIAYGQKLAAIFGAAQLEIRRRQEEVARLLANVDQGLVTVDAEGRMSTERSAAFESMFGPAVESMRFSDQLAHLSPDAQTWFDIGWESILDGFMPDEVLVEQLPQRLDLGGRHIALRYRVLRDGETFLGMLVVSTDITSEVERELAETSQKEVLALFQRIARDRLAVVEFVADAQRIVRTIDAGTEDDATEKRLVHTLKGNAGFYGLQSMVDICHALESHAEETGEPFSSDGRADLVSTWERIRGICAELLGSEDARGIELSDQEYRDILQAVVDQRPHAEIAASIQALKLEPVERRLTRMAEQAKALAARLGRGTIEVDIEHGGLRTDPDQTAPFWQSLVHVVRNAVDHGIDGEVERVELGKPTTPTLRFTAREDASSLVLEMADDGRGIDFDALRASAEQRVGAGLTSATLSDVDLLFIDGLSTRAEVSEVSGRGVGMGAVRAELRRLGGELEVDTTAGQGTVFRFRLPLDRVSGLGLRYAS